MLHTLEISLRKTRNCLYLDQYGFDQELILSDYVVILASFFRFDFSVRDDNYMSEISSMSIIIFIYKIRLVVCVQIALVSLILVF